MAAMPSNPSPQSPSTATHTVRLNGTTWYKLADCPRVVADSWRQVLAGHQLHSALLTPWGWVFSRCAIELHAGPYTGDVGLYVPAHQAPTACDLLGLPTPPAPASAASATSAAPDVPGLRPVLG
jgi:hypothetical protein